MFTFDNLYNNIFQTFFAGDFLYRYKNKGKIFGVKRYIKKTNRLKIWKKFGPALVGIC